MDSFNSKKYVDHWKSSALADLDTSELLIENRKILHGLFWCHLSIEKILKACFVKFNSTFAPKTHNLLYLARNAKLELSDEQLEFLGVLMKYQLEGRYQDYKPNVPSIEMAQDYLLKTLELFEWLEKKLSS